MLAAASLRGSGIPRGSPGKEDGHGAHQRPPLILREKYFWVDSLSLQPFGHLEVVVASVRTSFPDRKGAAKAAASGFTKTRLRGDTIVSGLLKLYTKPHRNLQ